MSADHHDDHDHDHDHNHDDDHHHDNHDDRGAAAQHRSTRTEPGADRALGRHRSDSADRALGWVSG